MSAGIRDYEISLLTLNKVHAIRFPIGSGKRKVHVNVNGRHLIKLRSDCGFRELRKFSAALYFLCGMEADT